MTLYQNTGMIRFQKILQVDDLKIQLNSFIYHHILVVRVIKFYNSPKSLKIGSEKYSYDFDFTQLVKIMGVFTQFK